MLAVMRPAGERGDCITSVRLFWTPRLVPGNSALTPGSPLIAPVPWSSTKAGLRLMLSFHPQVLPGTGVQPGRGLGPQIAYSDNTAQACRPRQTSSRTFRCRGSGKTSKPRCVSENLGSWAPAKRCTGVNEHRGGRSGLQRLQARRVTWWHVIRLRPCHKNIYINNNNNNNNFM